MTTAVARTSIPTSISLHQPKDVQERAGNALEIVASAQSGRKIRILYSGEVEPVVKASATPDCWWIGYVIYNGVVAATLGNHGQRLSWVDTFAGYSDQVVPHDGFVDIYIMVYLVQTGNNVHGPLRFNKATLEVVDTPTFTRFVGVTEGSP